MTIVALGGGGTITSRGSTHLPAFQERSARGLLFDAQLPAAGIEHILDGVVAVERQDLREPVRETEGMSKFFFLCGEHSEGKKKTSE